MVHRVIWWGHSVRVGTGAFHNLILVLDDIANEIARLVLIPWKEMEVVQTTNNVTVQMLAWLA